MNAVIFRGSRTLGSRLLRCFWQWSYILVFLSLVVIMVWRGSLPAIKKFELEGGFINFSSQQAEQLLRELSDGKNYFTVDLDALRGRLEAFAWVKHVSVDRVWPQTVRIGIEEHKPYAVLNGSALLSAEGAVFYPPLDEVHDRLPLIEAPVEAAPRLLRRLQALESRMEAFNLRPMVLQETERQAMRLYLSNGWTLVLGRSQQEKKIERFLQAYPKLMESNFFHRIDSIDLRYPDGFTVACRERRPCRL